MQSYENRLTYLPDDADFYIYLILFLCTLMSRSICFLARVYLAAMSCIGIFCFKTLEAPVSIILRFLIKNGRNC